MNNQVNNAVLDVIESICSAPCIVDVKKSNCQNFTFDESENLFEVIFYSFDSQQHFRVIVDLSKNLVIANMELDEEEVISCFGEPCNYVNGERVMKLTDIFNVYLKGMEESNGIEKGMPIPLNEIVANFDSFEPDSIESLKASVISLIEKSSLQRNSSKPDPLAALFQNLDRDFSSGDTSVNRRDYEQFERTRVADKWRGNHIGKLNELIAALPQQIQLSCEGQLDLVVFDSNDLPIAIIEVKNRWNTMNSSSAIRLRREIERHVLSRGSTFHQCKGILVERIPKGNGSDTYFSPSDPSTGEKTSDNDSILRMGLQQFLSQFANDQLAYMKGLIIIANTMAEKCALPPDYDMSFIFELLEESIN